MANEIHQEVINYPLKCNQILYPKLEFQFHYRNKIDHAMPNLLSIHNKTQIMFHLTHSPLGDRFTDWYLKIFSW